MLLLLEQVPNILSCGSKHEAMESLRLLVSVSEMLTLAKGSSAMKAHTERGTKSQRGTEISVQLLADAHA
jgi:hypothetical protein